MSKNRYKKASLRITKRSEIKRIFGLVLKIGLPVIFLIGLILFLRADFWQVKSFEVVGAETISAETLKNTARSWTSGNKFLFIPRANIFLLNKNYLATSLLSDFTKIEKIVVNKNFFNQQIKLEITERKADFWWCTTENQCFLMDKNGLIFAPVDEISKQSGKLIFTGGLEADPILQNFATPEQMQNYLKLVGYLSGGGFEVEAIDLESNNRAIAKTNIGDAISDIIFDPNEKDLILTAQNIILLIKEIRIKNPNTHFQYIDARFGNKFFYKLY